MTELKDSLERFEIGLLSPLCLILEKIPPGPDSRNRRQILIDRLKRPRLSLGISLMLGFIPRFFAVWDTAELAYRARGGKPGAAQMALLLPLVIERMIEGAMETAAALESRGCSL
jgi:energy-coupling factor transporter transmembrane protein EcfT